MTSMPFAHEYAQRLFSRVITSELPLPRGLHISWLIFDSGAPASSSRTGDALHVKFYLYFYGDAATRFSRASRASPGRSCFCFIIRISTDISSYENHRVSPK